MHFLPVFELTSHSVTTIQVELHRCPLHQSILLTQGPINEIFAKIFRELAILKNGHFEKSAIWNFFFFKKKFFLLHSHENQSKFIWQNGWVKILTFSLVSRKFLGNQRKRQNFNPSILPYKFGLIFIKMKQNFFFLFEK